jgi:hypothetical protein
MTRAGLVVLLTWNGDKQYKVRATLDGDAMDGSITYGTGKEYLWHAKRSKAK